jgi:ribosomal protein S18 acetylase RimI-like enzyme
MVVPPEIPVLVRKATPLDGEAVIRLRRVLRAEDGGSVHGPNDPAPTLQEEIARIAAQEREPGQLVLVAEAAGRVVGWLELTPGASSRTSHRAWVVLAVAADWRRQGIGRALMEHLHAWGANHPTLEQVALRCAESNEPAISLYRSLGYVEEGRFARGLKLGPGRYVDLVQLCRPLG